MGAGVERVEQGGAGLRGQVQRGAGAAAGAGGARQGQAPCGVGWGAACGGRSETGGERRVGPCCCGHRLGGQQREVSEDTTPEPLRWLTGALTACWLAASAPGDEWACLCRWRGRGGPQKERETGMGRTAESRPQEGVGASAEGWRVFPEGLSPWDP